jgi:hypothetical protein
MRLAKIQPTPKYEAPAALEFYLRHCSQAQMMAQNKRSIAVSLLHARKKL